MISNLYVPGLPLQVIVIKSLETFSWLWGTHIFCHFCNWLAKWQFSTNIFPNKNNNNNYQPWKKYLQLVLPAVFRKKIEVLIEVHLVTFRRERTWLCGFTIIMGDRTIPIHAAPFGHSTQAVCFQPGCSCLPCSPHPSACPGLAAESCSPRWWEQRACFLRPVKKKTQSPRKGLN